MPRPSVFKRTWIVNPQLQYGWMLYFGFGVGLLFLISYMGTSVAANGFAAICNDIPPDFAGRCEEALQSQRLVLRWIFILGGAASVLFIFVGSMVASNRIAGPIYRTLQYLERINRGENPEPLTFRHGDHYNELAQALNQALEKVRKR
jgi:hypothetical protein